MAELSSTGAILQCKCPQCRKGNIFKHSILNPFKYAELYENCPHCGLEYEVEPGFFIGAMYLGYGVSIALMVNCLVAIYVIFDDPSIWTYLWFTSLITVVMIPLNFRYSRALVLHLFGGIKYDQNL